MSCADQRRRACPLARLRIERPHGRSPSACPRGARVWQRSAPAREWLVESDRFFFRRCGETLGSRTRSAASPVGHGKVVRPSAAAPHLADDSTATTTTPFCQRPQIRRDDPLNLSISVSGGKETNQDSPSSGERRGKSPAPNPCPTPRAREMWRTEDRFPGCGGEPKSL